MASWQATSSVASIIQKHSGHPEGTHEAGPVCSMLKGSSLPHSSWHLFREDKGACTALTR